MTDEQPISPDQLISDTLGQLIDKDIVVGNVVVIVEGIHANGPTLSVWSNDGLASWQILGLLRSATLLTEHADLEQWLKE